MNSPGEAVPEIITARDPQSPPGRLRELAASPDPEVVAAIAVNPNTPLDLLIQLAPSCPAALLANPALALCEMEAPGAFRALSLSTAMLLLQQPAVPAWLVAQLLVHPSIGAERRSTLASTATATAVLAALASGAWGRLQGELARNPALSEEQARVLASDPEPAVRAALARRSRHPSVLEQLAGDALPLPRLLARARLRPPAAREPRALQAHGHESLGQRDEQEDAFVLAPLSGAFFALVVDGMGGHRTGKIAAHIIAREMPLVVGDLAPRCPVSEEADCLRVAIGVAEEELAWYAKKRGTRGYGAAVVALLICEDRAHLAHVGDSRIYRLRAGALEQMTRDHTLLNDHVEQGLLTPEQLASIPLKDIITRALGMKDEGVVPDQTTVIIEPGDLFLLCTDGLHDTLADGQMAALLVEHAGDAAGAARALVAAAEAAGAQDNITAVVVPCPAASPPAKGRQARSTLSFFVTDEPR